MRDWNNFYMLFGSTGTLIGLTFWLSVWAPNMPNLAMRSVSASSSRRFFHFASLLLIALATLAPASNVLRACILGAIGCVGLAYVPNLALLAKKRIKECEREFFWDALPPLAAYVCILVSAAACLLGASLAEKAGAVASVLLLVTALRNSWAITLAIINR